MEKKETQVARDSTVLRGMYPGHKGETGEKCDPGLLLYIWQQQFIVSEQVRHQMLMDITQLRAGGVRAGLTVYAWHILWWRENVSYCIPQLKGFA